MVPGFNTDFKYRGETYHVQTEDNGSSNPVVVTLLYHKGAILASRRTSYRELLGKPGFEQELMGLMKTQHKDLMRALLAGSFDKDGAAPAVSGGSGEDPAAAAVAVAASATLATAPRSAPRSAPPAATPAATRSAPPAATPTAAPMAAPAARPSRVFPAARVPPPAAATRPATASLDEAIREYLQTFAATAATMH